MTAIPMRKKIADFKDEYECVVVSPGIDLRKMANSPKVYTSEIELAHGKKNLRTLLLSP